MKPGKIFGIIALINVLLLCYATIVLPIFFKELNFDFMLEIVKIAFGIFTIIWTAVFGSGAIEKIKGTIEQSNKTLEK